MDTQINFRTSSEIREQMEKIAKDRNIKLSQLINDIVADFINREGNQKSEGVDIQALYQMVVSQERRIDQLEKKSAA
ncbi:MULTISPECIES: hypothetical protein [unclassified Scytonema]